jgi:hypothetical protein
MSRRRLAAAAPLGLLASVIGFTGAGAAVPEPPPISGAFSAPAVNAPAPSPGPARTTTRTDGGGNPLSDRAVPVALGLLLACAVGAACLPDDTVPSASRPIGLLRDL